MPDRRGGVSQSKTQGYPNTLARTDRSKVTLVLTEADARWLLDQIGSAVVAPPARDRIEHEIEHALAECGCAGAKT